MIEFLMDKFKEYDSAEALVWRNKIYSYTWIRREVEVKSAELRKQKILPGTIVELHADYSPTSIALLLALIEIGCIIVPTTKSVGDKRYEFQEIAEVEMVINVNENDTATYQKLPNIFKHPIFVELRKNGKPGLVLFSSGSTGKPKAAVHDFSCILEKFKKSRPAKRIINFLLFDHIGGINTLFHTLSNGGCVITVNERTPRVICETIEKHQVNVLPTSPTFLNLVLLSRCYADYNLASLELITYGTEVMPESTLNRLNNILPQVKISQTYGLSEIGIMRAKSKSSDSLYMKVGGEGFETRVVDGLLEVKAASAMLGYLNAESPFTDDGWFKTGDAVEVEGEYLKILGRKSEIINVGGEKVYPAEVESVIQLMDGVQDVSVSSEIHPIIGQIVKAHVTLRDNETLQSFRQRMREFCKNKIETYKIPQKIILMDKVMHNQRFKKLRKIS